MLNSPLTFFFVQFYIKSRWERNAKPVYGGGGVEKKGTGKTNLPGRNITMGGINTKILRTSQFIIHLMRSAGNFSSR